MFERVSFRRSDNATNFVDVGQIAEILFYYGSLDLLLDTGNLSYLLEKIGYDSLVRLVQHPRVNAIFVKDLPGVVTNSNVFNTHNFVAVTLHADSNGASREDKNQKIEKIFTTALGQGWLTKKRVQFFGQFISEKSLIKGVAGDSLIEDIRKDVLDRQYLESAAKAYLSNKTPSFVLSSGFRFQAMEFSNDFIIDTNLDFDLLNSEHKKKWPLSDQIVTSATILSEIFEARIALGIGANFKGDVIATALTSKLMKLRVSNVLKSLDSAQDELNAFEEWALDGKNIRDAINNGAKSFDEFLDFLEKSTEFNSWVSGRSDDQSLARDYVREISSKGWLDGLPAKSMRYAVFTGASIITGLLLSTTGGLIAGVGLSAADTFLVDKITKGWRPNHFVNGPLKKFVT